MVGGWTARKKGKTRTDLVARTVAEAQWPYPL
jgi:hypothetical protein